MKLSVFYLVLGVAWVGYSYFKSVDIFKINNKWINRGLNVLAWPISVGLYVKSLVKK